MLVGDSVRFVNTDSAPHTITSGTVSGGYDGNFDSGLLTTGESYMITDDGSDSGGQYRYFCMVHPWMTGLIIVHEGASSTPDPTPAPTPEPVRLASCMYHHTVSTGETISVSGTATGNC